MEKMITLKCEICGDYYKKPEIFQEYLIKTNYNIFYKWSLSFCDKCRHEKEENALKKLHNVINSLNDEFIKQNKDNE